jgi:hypothetical protein
LNFYRKIFCTLFNYYTVEKKDIAKAYFVISLLTFLESSVIVPSLLIFSVYAEFKFDTKLWGLLIFLTLAVLNYRVFILPDKIGKVLQVCENQTSHKNTKMYIRSTYFLIFILFVFSLIVEATEGYLYMVPVYIEELLK